MRRFYSPPDRIEGGHVILGADETRHLRDVLRLHVGDEASVFDGLGKEYLCRVESVTKQESILEVLAETRPSSPESPLEITVAAAILPGEKFEITVQKAVELGVQVLQPLYTKRCEVKPGGSGRKLERWNKIAVEAAKQSGRARLMEIVEPVDIAEFLEISRSDKKETVLVFFSEREGESFSAIKADKKIAAVFGPKGGWDDAELAAAKAAGFSIITFGGRIMRAETAAIVMIAILQHRFGDLS